MRERKDLRATRVHSRRTTNTTDTTDTIIAKRGELMVVLFCLKRIMLGLLDSHIVGDFVIFGFYANDLAILTRVRGTATSANRRSDNLYRQ